VSGSWGLTSASAVAMLAAESDRGSEGASGIFPASGTESCFRAAVDGVARALFTQRARLDKAEGPEVL